MAKRKRRRRSIERSGGVATVPSQGEPDHAPFAAVDAEHVSNRRLRKEKARRERERRMRAARRRVLLRRLVRWAAPVALIGAVATFLIVRNAQESQRAAVAAEAASCGGISTEPDQAARHTPPFVEGVNGVPASVGSHSSPLSPDPHVFGQPVPEANAVHNLEHGYALIYYRMNGSDALDPEIVARLEAVATDEDKVIMAPYEGLASKLALVAWRHVQLCDPSADRVDDAAVVTEHFIGEFRGGGLAPEPAAG